MLEWMVARELRPRLFGAIIYLFRFLLEPGDEQTIESINSI